MALSKLERSRLESVRELVAVAKRAAGAGEVERAVYLMDWADSYTRQLLGLEVDPAACKCLSVRAMLGGWSRVQVPECPRHVAVLEA